MFNGIDHTAIATPDPENLAEWYVDHLEFAIVHRYAGNVFVRATDGSMLAIIPSEGAPVDAKFKTPGIRHLAIKVDNFDEGRAILEGKGSVIFSEVNASGNRLAFFHDPEGNIIHRIHREVEI